MNSFEYIRTAGTTESVFKAANVTDAQMRLLHAALGMQTESAEFSDMLKRHIFYGARIDRINALEEAGDLLWYIAIVLVHFDSNFDDVMQANCAKLQFRYPEQFNEVMAQVRDTETERAVLESILNK